MKLLLLIVVCSFTIVAYAWPGVNLKPLAKPRSDFAPGESGTYYQLSDNERKELVWVHSILLFVLFVDVAFYLVFKAIVRLFCGK